MITGGGPDSLSFPGVPGWVYDRLCADGGRVLVTGPPGVGKSTLTAALAGELAERGHRLWCISADPGSPGFGVPGAVALASWRLAGWSVTSLEALCSLDAGRFRLPLLVAVRRLAELVGGGPLVVDSPGVVRGVAAGELLAGLVDVARIDAVLALTRGDRPPFLSDVLRALPVTVSEMAAPAGARPPGRRARERIRTRLWDAHLDDAGVRTWALDGLPCLGTPPPRQVPSSWVGRQVALLRKGRTLSLGEVVALDDAGLHVRAPASVEPPDSVLVRDARRSANGLLETAEPFARERVAYVPAPEMVTPPAHGGPPVMTRVGNLWVSLVNGVFGDPLLHLRVRHEARSMLFDLGEGARLQARIAHQVSDVFISHAHVDHIGGFLWLLRSRIGDFPPCRVNGPPGLAENIEGLVRGILWDRAGAKAPVFEVTELHGATGVRYRIRAGVRGAEPLEETTTADGVLLQEPGFRVRAATLDHGSTTVLAFAFEPSRQIAIRKDRLTARGLAPGPWLGALKCSLAADEADAVIELPDGSRERAGELGADLALVRPGKKLVYATDLADSPQNRRRLTALAAGAHTLFCESPFLEADREQAARTGHLTTSACAEIAEAAGVARLVPFHFSRRYDKQPDAVYEELAEMCRALVRPSA